LFSVTFPCKGIWLISKVGEVSVIPASAEAVRSALMSILPPAAEVTLMAPPLTALLMLTAEAPSIETVLPTAVAETAPLIFTV
jgi:hypothetical protein